MKVQDHDVAEKIWLHKNNEAALNRQIIRKLYKTTLL